MVGSQNFQFIIFKYYPPTQLHIIVQNMTQIVYKRHCFFQKPFVELHCRPAFFKLQGGVILSSTYLPKGTLRVINYINGDGFTNKPHLLTYIVTQLWQLWSVCDKLSWVFECYVRPTDWRVTKIRRSSDVAASNFGNTPIKGPSVCNECHVTWQQRYGHHGQALTKCVRAMISHNLDPFITGRPYMKCVGATICDTTSGPLLLCRSPPRTRRRPPMSKGIVQI